MKNSRAMSQRVSSYLVQMWVPTMRSVQLRNGLRGGFCVTGGGVLAGEAGMGCAEGVVLVSATMFILEVRECWRDLNDHVERKKN